MINTNNSGTQAAACIKFKPKFPLFCPSTDCVPILSHDQGYCVSFDSRRHDVCQKRLRLRECDRTRMKGRRRHDA
mgnify:CR=1 FL=1